MPMASLLSRLGLDRPSFGPGPCTTGPTSAMQTTIMVAVFPIYFVKVAGAGSARKRRHPTVGTVNTRRAGDHRRALPHPRRDLGLPRNQEATAGAVHVDRRRGRAGDVLHSTRGDLNLASVLCYAVSLIGVAGSFVFYEALLTAHCPAGGDRPGVHRRLRAGIRRRRPAPRAQSGVDPAAGLVWVALGAGPEPASGDIAGPPRLPVRRGLVAGLFPAALSPGSRAAGVCSSRTSSGARIRSGWRSSAWARPSASSAGYRQAFLMLLAFLIYNDGIQTIIKMATAYGTEIGHRPERADRGHPAGPVRGDPLLLPVRHAGQPDRRQAGAVPRTAGLHGHQRARIFHEDRHPFLPAGRRWWGRFRVAPRHSAARCSPA